MVQITEPKFVEIPDSIDIILDKELKYGCISLFKKKIPMQEKIDYLTRLMKIQGYYIINEPKPEKNNHKNNLLKALSNKAIDVFSIPREPKPLLEKTDLTVGELKCRRLLMFHKPYYVYNKEGDKIYEIGAGKGKTLQDIVSFMKIPIGSKFKAEEIEEIAMKYIKSEGLRLEDPYKKAEELKKDETPVNIELNQALSISSSRKNFNLRLCLKPGLSYGNISFPHLIKNVFNHLNILTGAYIDCINNIPDQKEKINLFNDTYEFIPQIAGFERFESLERAKIYIKNLL